MKKEVLEKCLRKCLNIENEEISFDENLKDYGMNSITLIKFLILIETELKIEFDEAVFNLEKYPTLNGILEYIESI